MTAVLDDWGAVPEDWRPTRLKFEVTFVGGGTPARDRLDYWGGNIPWVSPKDMKRELIGASEDSITERAVRESSVNWVPKGAVLLVVRSGILKHTIPVAVSGRALTLNQDMKALIPGARILADYLKFLVIGANTLLLQRWRKEGATVESLEHEYVANSAIFLPSMREQREIVAFLTRKTAAIDDLIRKKERLIELLEEKRQSVIAHGVTKGLDPSAALTADNGESTDWIGPMPAHWKKYALKRETRVQRGASPRPIEDQKYFDESGEYAWVRIQDATASGGYLECTSQRLSSLGASRSVKLEPGALFLSIAATVGVPCIAGIKCCIHDGFVYFPRLRSDPRYLRYVFESGEPYKGLGNLGTQLNLNTSTVGNIPVPVPPLDEQRAIARYLDEQTQTLELVIDKHRHSISLLKEYRQSLVSVAITGKLKIPASEAA